jgi:Tfp pilus assembly protein PilZ
MLRYTQKRADSREIYKVPGTVREADDSYVYRARIANYSRKGMYIETDVVLDTGADIIIGIEDSPDPFIPADLLAANLYLAKIVWQNDSIDSIFNFGYGVQIISTGEKRPAGGNNLQKACRALRKHHRESDMKPVYVIWQNHYHHGLINNISRGGAFIETTEKFSVGQTLRLIIPGDQPDKGVAIKGKVVHLKKLGIGIVFESILDNHPF